MAQEQRIWASLDDYLPPEPGLACVGRNMANYFFFKALLRHSTFDEYHVFLSNSAHRNLFMEQHDALFTELGVTHKIRLWDRMNLPHALATQDYTVFHQSDHITWFNALCRMRNSVGCSVPVTSFIHSVSYQRHMGAYLEMLHCGVTSNDAIICSSQCGKQVLEQCFAGLSSNLNLPIPAHRLDVIPLGIDQGIQTTSQVQARERLNIEAQDTVALCFGRFSDFDKMDLFPLLQAIKPVLTHAPNRRLILAGALHESTYLDMTQCWIKALGLSDYVTVVTDPSDAVKADLYSAADLFVSLADNVQETFGLTLIEAMQAGLPLIVSDFDGYRELCDDTVGIRIPTTWSPNPVLQGIQPIMDERTWHRLVAQQTIIDLPALTHALDHLFTHEPERQRMGQAARARFDSHFAHKHIITQLETLWQDLKTNFTPTESHPDPMAMNVFNSFAHYVTTPLSPDTQVKATDFALMLVHTHNHYPLLAGMADILDWPTITTCIKTAIHTTTLATLEQTCQFSAWKAQYTLAWMLKHGLLEMM